MKYIPIPINNVADFDRRFTVEFHGSAQTKFIVYGRNKQDALYSTVLFCIEKNFTEDFFTEESAKRFFMEFGMTFKEVAGKYLIEDELVIEEIEDYRF